jgi:hypothetical protein
MIQCLRFFHVHFLVADGEIKLFASETANLLKKTNDGTQDFHTFDYYLVQNILFTYVLIACLLILFI